MAIKIAPNPPSVAACDLPTPSLAVAKAAAEYAEKLALLPDPAPEGPRKVGRPPSGKQIVTLRLRPATIAKFKATGKGWQARMSDALDTAASSL